MLTTPLTLDTPSAGAPGEAAAPGASGAPDGGESFAGQLALAQAALPAGQNLAAGSLPLLAGTLPLQTLALGPQLEVITSPAGSPDSDSLAEFARAQGLDDEVVAWLFSDAAQAMAQASSLSVLPGAAGFVVLPGAAAAATVADAATPAAGALPAAAPPVLAGPGLAAPGLVGPALLAVQTPASATGAPADAELAAALAATATGTTTGTAGWLQQQARLAAGSTPADAADPAQVAITALSSSLMPVLAAAARGIRPDGASDTFKLSNASNGTPVEILSLDIEPGLEALWDEPAASGTSTGTAAGTAAGTGGGTGGGAGTGTGSGAGAAPGSPAPAAALADDGAPGPNPAQRAAGYQELSQRLGEALAQRVIAQVERGNWEIRLLLRPARLGEVEVDLSLRSGALDAAFRATNPVTRDLLNDGLPRLREVLAGAGMDIAGLNVGSGRSQHTGDNPTPRHARAPQGDEGADRSVTAAAAPASTPRLRGAGESGWDVLV